MFKKYILFKNIRITYIHIIIFMNKQVKNFKLPDFCSFYQRIQKLEIQFDNHHMNFIQLI